MILIFAALAGISGCSQNKQHAKAAAIRFELNADSSQIVLTGLDQSVLRSFKSDSLDTPALARIFTIVVQAENDELRGFEKPLPGKYMIGNHQLVYTPDSVFTKGLTYRADLRLPSYYNAKDVFKNKALPGKMQLETHVFDF